MRAKKNVSVIIPTYNERENIKKLIPNIEKLLLHEDINGEIIIIDDNSPDGTGKLAEALSKKYKNIRVIHRNKKEGVGSARRLGFSLASNPVIISMEGDNTHNPEYIPKFLQEIEKGADLVIGSRYLKESKIVNWPLKRRIISKVANFISRFFAGTGITDVTNGYRAFTKKLFNRLKIDSSGYPYNMEFACEAYSKGFKISEIPIVFIDREKGTSKLHVTKEFASFIATAFRFMYTYKPMKIFGTMGMFMVGVGSLIALYLVYIRLTAGIVGNRLPLIVLSFVLIISGIQIFSFGLIVNIISKLRKDIM